ncbi:MAG TPA: MFS transporter [Candidatus Eisenbacteria bacterium]|nr:MFS transporter [Candidatus Eisenbacteria bacterium]
MPLLILLSAFLEGIALTLIQGYLPLYVRETLGEKQLLTVGMVVVVPALGTMIASNFWGGLSDVSGKLKPMILVAIAGYVAVLVGTPLFRQGTSILLFVGAASLFYGCLAPLLKAYATLHRPDRPQNALAWVLMAQSTGWLIGGFEGGRLMESGIGVGLRSALWIAAGLLSVHFVLTLLLLRDKPRPPAAPRARVGWFAGVMEDLVALYENPRLLRLCFVAFLLYAGNFVVWGFFSVYFVEHLGASVRMLRYTLAASAVAGLAMYLLVPALVKRFGARATLAAGIAGYVVMYLVMGLMQSPFATAVIFTLPLYGLTNVSANTLATEYSNESQRGGGLGVLNGTIALSTIAGPLVGGSLADRWGLSVIPWVAFGYLAAALPLTLWAVRAGVPATAVQDA